MERLDVFDDADNYLDEKGFAAYMADLELNEKGKKADEKGKGDSDK